MYTSFHSAADKPTLRMHPVSSIILSAAGSSLESGSGARACPLHLRITNAEVTSILVPAGPIWLAAHTYPIPAARSGSRLQRRGLRVTGALQRQRLRMFSMLTAALVVRGSALGS